MKKTLFTLSIIFTLSAKAQILNPGFETWTTDTYVPTAMNPNSGNGTTGWWDYNIFNSSFVGSSPLSVFRCDTAHSGSYSARIETVIYTPTSWNIYKSWGVPYIGHNYYDTLGILYNGYVNETSSTSRPGFPFTQKINQFSFFYQYKPNGIDTAECRVSLVKAGTLIAGGVFKTNVTTGSTWQQATVTMFYVDTLTPDTMYVLFSSSSLDKKPKPGSMFLIDDISTSLPAGIEQLKNMDNQATIYPNPSNGNFVVETSVSSTQLLEMFDLTGRLVISKPITGKTLINGSDLMNGVYNIKITGGYGVTNKRIIISK